MTMSRTMTSCAPRCKNSAYVSCGAPFLGTSDRLTCAGDTVFCKHQQAKFGPFPTPPPSIPEWVPGDDHVALAEPARSLKSQRSVDTHFGKISARLSNRWPSISSRWRDNRPTTSVSSPTVRSAPPSRTASATHQSVKQSLASHLEPHETMLLFAPKGKTAGDASPTPSSPTLPQSIDLSAYMDSPDPIDREELASTPLLPPALTELRARQDESMPSPLQSPSVATPSTAATFTDTPLSSPIRASIHTPPLSAKTSFGSIHRVYSNHLPPMSSDGVDYGCAEEPDYYTMKLGHANFHIFPEPYIPERCNKESCNRLLLDWEAARREYMKHAFLISENYGPTSQTYKLTSEKWAQIDQEWQTNLNRARTEAEALGETPQHENLAQTVSVSHIPSLPFDPKNPEKYPALNEGGIVGPMVQYTRIQRVPSRRKNFLKLFLEPTGLLGARSPFRSRS